MTTGTTTRAMDRNINYPPTSSGASIMPRLGFFVSMRWPSKSAATSSGCGTRNLVSGKTDSVTQAVPIGLRRVSLLLMKRAFLSTISGGAKAGTLQAGVAEGAGGNPLSIPFIPGTANRTIHAVTGPAQHLGELVVGWQPSTLPNAANLVIPVKSPFLTASCSSRGALF